MIDLYEPRRSVRIVTDVTIGQESFTYRFDEPFWDDHGEARETLVLSSQHDLARLGDRVAILSYRGQFGIEILERAQVNANMMAFGTEVIPDDGPDINDSPWWLGGHPYG